MANNKVSWLFNGASDESGMTWGFSENWYTSLTGAALETAMDNVSANRIGILSRSTKIVGYRVNDGGGRAYVIRKNYTAPRGNDTTNIPVDAALCQCYIGATGRIKKFFIHDLPDDWVTDFAIQPNRFNILVSFIHSLAQNQFQIRTFSSTAPIASVLAIDALGNVVTQANFAVAPNDVVQMLHVRDTNGRAVRGNFVVETVATGTTFKLRGWAGQVVGRSGTVRKLIYDYQPVIEFAGKKGIIRGGSRKPGRPFFQLRGRAPVRR